MNATMVESVRSHTPHGKEKRCPTQRQRASTVIADLSAHYVEGFVLLEGHTAQRFDHDYGYDLLIVTYDEHGYVSRRNPSSS